MLLPITTGFVENNFCDIFKIQGFKTYLHHKI